MKTVIIIPAHNEELYIGQCLDAFINQTVKPDLLLVVDDTSTDKTAAIVAEHASVHPWIILEKLNSEAVHQPGAKVVRAFNYGLSKISDDFEFIGKFDADIVLPENYFEKIYGEFNGNLKLGMCSGLLYVKDGKNWTYEAIANKSHVRGPIKLYNKSCFEAIGGLRPGIGWDTADVLLAQYHGYETRTLDELKVKHLRPTAMSYNKYASFKQGNAYYALRYGFIISLLASLKMAWYKKSIAVIWRSLQGYFKASRDKLRPLVSEDEGQFIRKLRWQNIRKSLF